MIGATAEFADGVLISLSRQRIGFRRNRAHLGEHQRGSEFVSHREGAIGAVEAVFELVGGVKGTSDRQAEGDEAEFDRPQDVPKFAPTGFAEPAGSEFADRLDHDSLRAEFGGFADLFAD